MAKSKDLFDDSTMSFGEHLEILRVHLWWSVVGIAICVVFTLFFGQHIIKIVRKPIDEALQRHGLTDKAESDIADSDELMSYVKSWFNDEEADQTQASVDTTVTQPMVEEELPVPIRVKVQDLADALHQASPEQFPETEIPDAEIELKVIIPSLRKLEGELQETAVLKPVTLNVQEAFLTYLKVSFISGFVLASPWVFYQLWLFVAAGLYPHERKYVYIYLPLCLGLFLGGAVFCFFMVFPFVLDFLLGFNKMMGVVPQIRLSEWISFAVMLPLMFGLSFQLPIVMLLLERINIFEESDYREKRRMAILVIAIVSMLMTPADPASMLMMMFPLIFLYEFGIIMCRVRGPSPERA